MAESSRQVHESWRITPQTFWCCALALWGASHIMNEGFVMVHMHIESKKDCLVESRWKSDVCASLLWEIYRTFSLGHVPAAVLGGSVKLVCMSECPFINLSCKKLREVAVSHLGQFLSRCCFTLCVTMKVEPRIAKQYKCHHRCRYKNYQGKGTWGKKCLFFFFGWPEDCEFVEKMRFGASYDL